MLFINSTMNNKISNTSSNNSLRTKYVVGSGIGSHNRAVYRALLRRSNNDSQGNPFRAPVIIEVPTIPKFFTLSYVYIIDFNLTIEYNEVFTIPDEYIIIISTGRTLTNNGLIVNNSVFRIRGTLDNKGTINNIGLIQNYGTINNGTISYPNRKIYTYDRGTIENEGLINNTYGIISTSNNVTCGKGFYEGIAPIGGTINTSCPP